MLGADRHIDDCKAGRLQIPAQTHVRNEVKFIPAHAVAPNQLFTPSPSIQAEYPVGM